MKTGDTANLHWTLSAAVEQSNVLRTGFIAFGPTFWFQQSMSCAMCPCNMMFKGPTPSMRAKS